MASVGNKTISWFQHPTPPTFDANFPNSARPSGAQSLPLADFSNFVYQGACRLNSANIGTSGLRNNVGPIAVDLANNRIFAISHSWEWHVGAFTLPTLSMSSDYNALPVGANEQAFFDQTLLVPTALNAGSIVDKPTYMAVINSNLAINAAPYYSGAGTSPETTIVLQDLNSLATGAVKGWHKLDVAERGSQWMTSIPTEWQTVLGGDYIWGAGNSKLAINGRLTMGMSAYVTDSSQYTGAVADSVSITTSKLMTFKYGVDPAFHYDKNNVDRLNDLWGELGGPQGGFIIPGTRTYCVIGTHGGEKGTQYKLPNDAGAVSGGYGPRFIADDYYKYWLFDLNDMVNARDNVNRGTFDILPYDYGKFTPEFLHVSNAGLDPDGNNALGGISWDEATKTFYMFMRYDQDNVLVAYRYI